ncbi:penicillin-binding protein 1A [Natronospira proteinivora]|uniref:Penicillin-binding protein 1A n=1 Tax=Natronospira proteinivora TaxID=1807133 RepID=A0ABT1GAC8_9GAMM|nr:penicillin-binding protein 1A [Natronospira proteinivora]MCP1728007.1 penicillin-binding protein 1A [Natronospira proteinivora]
MKRFSRILVFLLGAGFTMFVVGIGVIIAAYLYVAPDQPDVQSLREVDLQEPMRIYSRDGRLMAEFGEEHRKPLSYDEIPEQLRQAFIAAEDDRFYEHPGVDYQGLIRAAVNLVRTRERSQGGSTITMQLARNFFLTRDRTYVRKISEIFLALKIEREFTKEEILTLYLNKIYLGQRAYGVGAAAEIYYGADVDELTLAQMAMIGGLPKAPSRDNPVANPDRATGRRGYVLGRMHTLGMIDQETYAEATMAPVTAGVHSATIEVDAPFVAEMVRREMVERFGEQEAYTGGYQVTTSLDASQQSAAQESLRNGLIQYDRRHGWRGPAGQVIAPDDLEDDSAWASRLSEYYRIAHLHPAAVVHVDEDGAEAVRRNGERINVPFSTMEWAEPFVNRNRRGPAPEQPSDVVMVGDVVFLEEEEDYWALSQVPEIEGSVVAIDPDNGAIRALAGGFDFRHSQFNRGAQALRQPGSALKPFIYSAALAHGFTPASLVNDAPVVEGEGTESIWRPVNYTRRFFGPTRLREALVHSRNLVSVRILRSMGISNAVDFLRAFGFTEQALPRDLTLALGTGEMTPLDLTRGYAVFANGGYRVEPWFIESIHDRHGETIYQAQPKTVCPDCEVNTAANGSQDHDSTEADETWRPSLFDDELQPQEPLQLAERVITPQNAFLINSMLQDVIRQGTGRGARQLGRSDLAGKTGTANEYRDAWFSGYNRNLVATAWVGFDRSQPMGPQESGGRTALPIWREFMSLALLGEPETSWEQPPGLVSVRISRETGLMVGADHPNGMFELFPEDQLPEREDSDNDEEVSTEDLF